MISVALLSSREADTTKVFPSGDNERFSPNSIPAVGLDAFPEELLIPALPAPFVYAPTARELPAPFSATALPKLAAPFLSDLCKPVDRNVAIRSRKGIGVLHTSFDFSACMVSIAYLLVFFGKLVRALELGSPVSPDRVRKSAAAQGLGAMALSSLASLVLPPSTTLPAPEASLSSPPTTTLLVPLATLPSPPLIAE